MRWLKVTLDVQHKYKPTYYPFRKGHPIELATQNTVSNHHLIATLMSIGSEISVTKYSPKGDRKVQCYLCDPCQRPFYLQVCSTYYINKHAS